mgnify:CR=1 FL=1
MNFVGGLSAPPRDAPGPTAGAELERVNKAALEVERGGGRWWWCRLPALDLLGAYRWGAGVWNNIVGV